MYDKIIKDLIDTKARSITYFFSPKEIIRVVRTRYSFGFNRGNLELTVTRGKPNFAEREWKKNAPAGQFLYKYLPKKKKNPVKSRPNNQ